MDPLDRRRIDTTGSSSGSKTHYTSKSTSRNFTGHGVGCIAGSGKVQYTGDDIVLKGDLSAKFAGSQDSNNNKKRPIEDEVEVQRQGAGGGFSEVDIVSEERRRRRRDEEEREAKRRKATKERCKACKRFKCVC